MCMKSCLCWRDLLTPSVATAVFAMTTSLIQIAVTVAVFSGFMGLSSTGLDGFPGDDGRKATISKLYIALAAFDFFVVLFSLIYLIAVERNGGHRFTAVPWIIWIAFYICYESAINIYYFTQEFGTIPVFLGMYSDRPRNGVIIVALVYWSVKELILFVGWWCILSRLCYWSEHQKTDSDSTLQLVHTGASDSFTPVFYNGGSTQVQIRENPRPAHCAHIDVVRPTSSFQVYGHSPYRGLYGGSPAYVQY